MTDLLEKGPILEALEDVLNDKKNKKLRFDMLQDLMSPNWDIWVLGKKYGLKLTESQRKYIEKYWSGKRDLEVLRKGLVVALSRAMDPSFGNPGPTERARELDIDCYVRHDPYAHRRDAGHHHTVGELGHSDDHEHSDEGDNGNDDAPDVVEVSVAWTLRQVTVFIHTNKELPKQPEKGKRRNVWAVSRPGRGKPPEIRPVE